MRIVVVMDPVSTVVVDEDTTFALMLEAASRGHRIDHCLVQDVELERGRPMATVRPATLARDPNEPVSLGTETRLALDEADCVWVRKDPPFDAPYLWLTLILDALRGRCLVMNDPTGIRKANEKLYACHFPELMPETIVTARQSRIREFLEETGRPAIIKPVDGHGGAGVFRLDVDDGNFNAAVEVATDSGRRVAMVQAFLPEVAAGDKRILLLDGEPLGAILRVPQGGDHRSNIHVGGKVVAASLDDADRAIVETVAPRLRNDRLFFVGLDVIGGKLTEVNVTSPTGIQQMSRLDGRSCEADVIDWVEKRIHAI